MSKVRINDLARELEVKSKAILDTLPLVGVTEKKTHSSSLEEHEAEKVRVYIRSSAEGSSSAGKSSSRAVRGEEEIKTKIDLSNISRPGDVLRAITQKKEAAAPPAARPAAPVAAEKLAVAPPAAVSRPTTVAPPVIKPAAPPAATASASPATPAVSVRPAATPSSVTSPAAATPARPAAPPPVAQVPPAAPVSASATPAAPSAGRPAAPPPQVPRMIVPQTGPRPVYKAPLRPAAPVQPGVPIGGTSRPVPGRPVPGQPIFQRRPPAAGGVPGAPRPPLRPGERRPMHPTRSAPAGARPLGVGPALPPPGTTRPGSRPGGPARRPGQRYVPRGVRTSLCRSHAASPSPKESA